MHYLLRQSVAFLLLIAMLVGVLPAAYAQEADPIETTTEATAGATNVVTTTAYAQEHNLTYSQKKILAYWLDPSIFTINETNIDRLTARGVTDIYVLVKGEGGTLNTTDLESVISYANSGVRVHAWINCARDNAFIAANPEEAAYHFRVGFKNAAHATSSSYYDGTTGGPRTGYVNLRSTKFQSYFKTNFLDKIKGISGLDGIHLELARFGADYYDWGPDVRTALGKTYYNQLAKALCAQYGYTYSTDSSGYYVFKGTTTADGTSFKTLIEANGAAAQAFFKLRTDTVTNFVKYVNNNIPSTLTLSATVMPEVADSNYYKAVYGQDPAALAAYVDYVVAKSYYGDFYAYNGNAYTTSWPADIAKKIANMGCNVVAGIQGHAFVNTDSAGRNGMNPKGEEAQAQAEYINDARRSVNGNPSIGGDILGSAVFSAGFSGQVKITYNPTDKIVTFSFVNGIYSVASYQIDLEQGFYVDKSRCTVDTSKGTYSFTYSGTTYTYNYGGTASNNYYPRVSATASIAAYGVKTIVVPVCTDAGAKVTPNYNNNHFAEFMIYNSTTKNNSTALSVYQESFVNSAHTSCSYTKTTPVVATCTTDGYNLYTCSTCGYDYTEHVASGGHTYTSVVTPATCTEAGITTHTCANCGGSYTDNPVEALGHNYEGVVTEPTCTEAGGTTYTCANCNDAYIENTVPALGHDFGDGAVAIEPSCTEEGIRIYHCANCGESYNETIPLSGHTYTSVVTPATCLTNGYTTYTCTDCGYSYDGDEVKKTGHNYVDVVTPPTCFNMGYTTHTCSNEGCDDSFVSNYTAAIGHQYDYQIVEPTCTEVGYTVSTCVCGDEIIDDYVAATGHTLSYTDNGTNHTATCANCGYNVTEEHNIEDFYCANCKAFCCDHANTSIVVDVAVTCTTEGSQRTVCDGCGQSLFTETVSATGHSGSFHEAKKATCEEAGNRAYWMCENCSQYFTDSTCSFMLPAAYVIIAPIGHSYTSTVVAPTCTSGGFTNYSCLNCDNSYTTDEVPALSHNYRAVATAPTCTVAGYTTYTCSSCGDSYTGNELPALGHSYVYTNNGENHTVSCDDCSYSATEAHDYIDGTCICNAVENAEPEYVLNENLTVSMSISVGAEMQVMYTILNTKVKNFESFYLEVVKEVVGGESVTTVYSLADGNMEARTSASGALLGYTATYTGIYAMEMGDSFTATLYAVAADGTVNYGVPVTSSIKSFLMETLANEKTIAELKTLAVDMLNYGAAAQVYFDYDAANLVNTDLTEEQKALGTQAVPTAQDQISIDGTGGNITTSVTLQSKVVLYVNCSYTKSENSNLEFVVKDAKTNEELDRFAPSRVVGKICQGSYDNVGARQMRDLIKIELYDNGVLVSKTLTWNIESYVAQTRVNSASSESLVNTVNAMLNYGDSAAVYLEATGQ